jgi:hypothetical protein
MMTPGKEPREHCVHDAADDHGTDAGFKHYAESNAGKSGLSEAARTLIKT